MIEQVKVQLPIKVAFLFEPHRYKVLYGGRGGAKSYSMASALLLQAADRPMRILCAREFQISIKDSVHKLLADRIVALGLEHTYDVQRTTILGKNGSEFIFSGLKTNITKIKSMEGVDLCWVEEAETVSEESWQVLIPTIRKEGSEIWVSFNPKEEKDPTYKRFVTSPPPECAAVEMSWSDNPWISEELLKEKDYLYRVDPEAADHVWGGKTRRATNAQVLYKKYVVEPFEPHEDWGGPYQGIDWGFATDPTTLIRCWVEELDVGANLYVEYEAYGVGVDINETPQLFDSVPNARDYVSRADNARPETISYMKQHGYPLVEAVEKWPGSVNDGVAHLRGYEKIVIHTRCVHAIEEARLWSYKVDRLTGDVLPVLVDKHQHCWDAGRYALCPLIKGREEFYFV